MSSYKQEIIGQAKFTYSPLGKAFVKQTKTIEDQGEKQIKAVQDNKKQIVVINDDNKNIITFIGKRKRLKIFIMKNLIK